MDAAEHQIDDTTWSALPGWQDAYRGLRVYFRAVIAYLVLLGVTLLMTVIVMNNQSMGMLEAMFYIVGAGELVISGVALGGLWRYSRVPAESGGKNSAKVAALIAAARLALHVWILVDFIAVGSFETYIQAETPLLDFISQVSGLLMLIFFLQSMKAVAAFIERYEIHALISTTLAIFGGLLVLILFTKLVLASASGIVGMRVVLGLLILALAIWGLVNYMLVIHRLSRSIEKNVDVVSAF